jgi:hypothetical protein
MVDKVHHDVATFSLFLTLENYAINMRPRSAGHALILFSQHTYFLN